MEEGEARQLAGEWRGLVGERSAVPPEEYLVHALGGLLPDKITASGAVNGVDGAAIVALDARRIFVARPRDVATETGVELTVNTLDLRRTEIAVTEEFVEAPRLTRRRRWLFSDRVQEVAFTTEQSLRNAFAFERTARKDELLARAIAAALGWTVPFSGEDR